MLVETYLNLLKQELNKSKQYVEEQEGIFYLMLTSPEPDLYIRSMELVRLMKECNQRISFYETQLKDLGFYEELPSEIKLNQTLTGNC